MDFKTKNIILLTGAGFTNNFGGFLASEMWAKIFNNPLIQTKEKIRDLLLNNFDFESVYFEVTSKDIYSSGEKDALKQAVENAYKDLDNTIKDWVFNHDNPTALNIYGLGGLLGLFSGNGDEKGFFFTLNQDLFMERKNNYACPGVPRFPASFHNLDKNNFVTLPRNVEKAKRDMNSSSGLIYIKLHGSYGWLSQGVNSRMVLGKNKLEDINQEPLLKWYLELFQGVINEGGKKLLIIGYGYRDEHINKILLDGVKNFGLSLYIINPSEPYQFKQMFYNGIYYALPLWSAVNLEANISPRSKQDYNV